MKLSSVEIKKTVKKFKSEISKEIIVSFSAIIIFSYVFYLAFFGFELSENEIFEYTEPFKNNCCEYDDFANNAGANIKNLVEDSQIEELKYYDELIDERSYDKREDPFTESL